MFVNFRHARVVALNLLLEEHLHSFPARWVTRFTKTQPDCVEELSDSSRFECQTRADEGATWRLRPENRARAERAHDFIVAHINHPEVALFVTAIAGDLTDDMGIDGRDGNV